LIFLRTFWLGALSLFKLSLVKGEVDKRIAEGKRDILHAVGRSAATFALIAAVGSIILYSGLIAVPQFWDSYSKGRQEYDRRHYKEAEELFHTATKANPKDIDTRLYYARSIWNQYVFGAYADKARNEDVATRAIIE